MCPASTTRLGYLPTPPHTPSPPLTEPPLPLPVVRAALPSPPSMMTVADFIISPILPSLLLPRPLRSLPFSPIMLSSSPSVLSSFHHTTFGFHVSTDMLPSSVTSSPPTPIGSHSLPSTPLYSLPSSLTYHPPFLSSSSLVPPISSFLFSPSLPTVAVWKDKRRCISLSCDSSCAYSVVWVHGINDIVQ